jgi:hypothetical protein
VVAGSLAAFNFAANLEETDKGMRIVTLSELYQGFVSFSPEMGKVSNRSAGTFVATRAPGAS